MNRAAWVFGLVSISIVTTAHTAHALGPVDVEIGAKVGGATNPNSAVGAVNPFGFGIGARAGVVLLDHLYGGVDVMYYFGGSGPPIGVPNPTGTISSHTLVYGGEAGWGFKLIDILTIRPQVGLGNASISVSGNIPGAAYNSPSSLYVEPGVTVLLSLGVLFVGADANVLVLTQLDESNAVFTAHAQVGMKF